MHSLRTSLTIAGDQVRPAINILATGDEPLKKRLIEAWMSHLSCLDGEELNGHIQKRFDRILNMVEMEALAIDAIEQLTLDEAKDLALLIVEFGRDLDMELGARS